MLNIDIGQAIEMACEIAKDALDGFDDGVVDFDAGDVFLAENEC